MNLDSGEHNCFSCGFGGSFAKLVRLVHGSWDRDQVSEWIVSRKVQDVACGKTRSASVKKKEPEAISKADLYKFIDQFPFWALDARRLNTDEGNSSLKRYGVLWNRENASWILPIQDPFSDNLWGWQEKNQDVDRGSGPGVMNYPKEVRKSETLFGIDVVRGISSKDKVLIVVESPIDAVHVDAVCSLDASVTGGCYAVATFGTQVSETQLNLLCEFSSGVVMMFDNDHAGHTATRKVCHALSGRVNTHIFSYRENGAKSVIHAPCDGRDPGNLTDAEIVNGILNVTPAFRTTWRD